MSTPALSNSTLKVWRNMWDVPSIPASLKIFRYRLWNVLRAPLGLASPPVKEYFGLPFLTFNNSSPSHAGMTLFNVRAGFAPVSAYSEGKAVVLYQLILGQPNRINERQAGPTL